MDDSSKRSDPRYSIDALTDYPEQHTDRQEHVECMHRAGWGGSTELLRAIMSDSSVLPETVKTSNFDTASTASSEQFSDLC